MAIADICPNVPIGDRVGRKTVIWISILGVAPFTLALPHAGLPGTRALTIVIGLVNSSAFSAIVVFARELAPTRVSAKGRIDIHDYL